jgi:ParB family transcriptional regulator, chromosome partitioning protein
MQSQMAILFLAAITLIPDPQNPRKGGDSEAFRLELHLLGQDMKRRGVLVPLIVRRNGDVYIVIDGHRRLAAALLPDVGIKELPCIVVDANTTEAQVRQIQLVTSLTKADLTAYERYAGISSLKALTPGIANKQLAAEVGITEGLLSQYLSLDKCSQPVKDAAAKQGSKIGLNDWYALSKLPEEQQAVALAARLNGASNGEMKRLAKPKAPAVRVARVKCQLPSGTVVTLAAEGDGLEMDDVIQALADLLKSARKAEMEGLDASTWQRVLKDKAGKG